MLTMFRNIKIFFLLVIFISLTACIEIKKQMTDIKSFMNTGPIDDFEPKEFIVEKQDIIRETTSLGPKVNKSNIEDKKSLRRIYIDETAITDYSKIINRTFTKTFPISINFDNVDIRTVMETFSYITGKNILVGDEVEGVVKVKVINENWDEVLEAILEIKNIGLTLNQNTNIVRIHKKEVIEAQEAYNAKRKAELRKSIEFSKSMAPVRSEIFKLFYSEPSKVKSQIEEILQNLDATVAVTEGEESSETTTGSSQRVKMTIDERLRALIVLGSLEDLDFIEKLIDKIDIPTKQILIEAFIVEAGSDFDKELGSRVGAKYGPLGFGGRSAGDTTNQLTLGGITGGAATALTLGGTTGGISNQSVGGATGSLGILVDTSALDLQIELTAMESMGISKIISNPKIFTLDNETAVITQGFEIPYESTSSEGTQTEFKEAALKLEVTPSIVGDGNIILEIKINKDTADTSLSNPPVSKTEITTKLLIADGTIVVIGGIYKETLSDTVNKTPFLSDLPFIGNLFKKVKKGEDLDRLLIFIAPRIL